MKKLLLLALVLFSTIIIFLASNIAAKDSGKPKAYRASIGLDIKSGITISFYDYKGNRLSWFGRRKKSVVDFFSKKDVEYFSESLDLTTLTIVIDDYTYRGFLFPEPSVVKRVWPLNEQGEMHFDNKTAYRARLIYKK